MVTTSGRDIHPGATLSRLYFENQLCSAPITSADGTTESGVKIIIGDPRTPTRLLLNAAPIDTIAL